MFAKGPQCTNAGCPSRVWTRFGLSVSLSRTAIEPAACSCSAVTGSPLVRVADGDRAQPGAQVLQVGCDGRDRHHLGRGGDVEAGLTRVAVRLPAETDDDVAQRAVVDVHAAPPADREGVDAERVPVQQMRLEHRGEQVVRGADRVDVAREVQVHVLHRHDLRVAAAGRAALDPEHGAERCLPQAERDALAEVAEPLRQRHRRGGLSLAGLRRRDRRHVDQLAVRPVRETVEHRERDLRLVAAVRVDLVGLEPGGSCDLGDRLEHGLLGDLEGRWHR